MTEQWYALRSKPRKEEFLWRQLALHEIECYYPRVRVRVTRRSTPKYQPYFPGYLFGRVDLEQVSRHIYMWLPGLAGIVTFGGFTPPIADSLIERIRARVDEINALGNGGLEGLKPGDAVMVQEGPFKGYEGILDARISGKARVRVLLKLLNNSQIALELPGGYIQLANR